MASLLYHIFVLLLIAATVLLLIAVAFTKRKDYEVKDVTVVKRLIFTAILLSWLVVIFYVEIKPRYLKTPVTNSASIGK